MKKFIEIMTDWYSFFQKMKVGEYVEVATVAKRDPVLFIEMCKVFINDNPDFEFSNDYKYFKRISPF